MKALTLKDYQRMSVGKELERTDWQVLFRTIEGAVINFGGMGATKHHKDEDIRKIPIYDNANIILPIRTKEQAYKLLYDIWPD